MWSVKLNALKSYVKQNISYGLVTLSGLVSGGVFANQVSAVEATEKTSVNEASQGLAQHSPNLAGASAENLVAMLMALLFVVLVIIAIAYVAKKFNLTPVSGSHFKMVSSMSLGGRERIVIVEVQGQQHAIGVTNQSVNHLFKLDQPIVSEPTAKLSSPVLNKVNKLFGYQAPTNTSKD